MKKKQSAFTRQFDKFSTAVTKATGRPIAFFIALCTIIAWSLSGPVFQFSDTWQLVINTGTTIITFLMVFIIQQSQNKETMAIQLKLNELLAASKDSSNRLVDIEDLSESELEVIKKYYVKLSRLAQKETELFSTHSLDEASQNHSEKTRSFKK